MSDLKHRLMEFGFTDKEALVYLAMLELGASSAQDIAKKSGVNRATTYVMIESLKRRGLISTAEQGKKTVYAAESPHHLGALIETEVRQAQDRKERLMSLMPEFMALFNAMENKPKVRYFEGEEGVTACREMIMELAEGGRVSRTIIHYNKEMVAVAKQGEAQRLRLTSGAFSAQILYTIDPECSLPIFGRNVQLRSMPSSLQGSFVGEANIYENFILVGSPGPKPILIIIESREVARLFQKFFDLAWLAAEKK